MLYFVSCILSLLVVKMLKLNNTMLRHKNTVGDWVQVTRQ